MFPMIRDAYGVIGVSWDSWMGDDSWIPIGVL